MQFDKRIGWWMPDGERHLPAWMLKVNAKRDGRLLYQDSKYKRALKFVPPNRRRHAIDIGGHVGLWSWQMAKDFENVTAFEPMPEHAECYRKNMADFTNCTLREMALGPACEDVFIRTRTPGSSGDTGVDLNGEGVKVKMHPLDSFEFTTVDFIKIDCEGFEKFVLTGARETVCKNRPVIIVEQKPETGMEEKYGVGTTDAVKLLESWGMTSMAVMAGDYIMVWK